MAVDVSPPSSQLAKPKTHAPSHLKYYVIAGVVVLAAVAVTVLVLGRL
jgi:hypothetical protein